MPKLVPYGENGVTNQLLAAFVHNSGVYGEFVANIHWHIVGKTDAKTSLGQHMQTVVQQMGLGRRKGKGEPDGVIIGNRYVIIIETKMGNPSALVYTNKKEILSNYVRMGREIAGKKWDAPKSYGGNRFLDETVVEPLRRISNNRWYLLFITDGEWAKVNKKLSLIITDLIANNPGLTERHVGWIGLRDIRAIADKYKLTDLQNALKANGKYS